MALALSKQVAREELLLAAAIADFAPAVVRWNAFAEANTAAVAAWPKEPDGTLEGYRRTPAQLLQIKALTDDLTALAAEHAAALALLEEVRS